MRLSTIAFIIISIFFLPIHALGQEGNSWTLQRSVQYALQHNISIQQNVLNERLAKLTLLQSQLSQLPNANASGNYGRSFGRSVDPTSNQFVSGSSYDFVSLGANVDVLVFGWFQKRNTISKNRYTAMAAQADLDQLRDDVSLNVATGYLRALLAHEQIGVSEKQVELSKAQLDQTRRFAEAGRLPELNVAQLEAQLAGDSSNLITAISDYNSSILDIKALLNLDFATEFVPVVPDVNISEQAFLTGVTPEQVYNEAVKRFGTVRSSQLKLAAAQKGLAAAKGSLWPNLSIGGQFGTNYATTAKNINVTGISLTPVTGSYAVDPVTHTQYPLYQSTPTYTTSTTAFNTQFDNNFRQTVSLNLNIPIFNAWQSQYSVRQAKINIESQQWNVYQAELKLKQDVYKAYNDALSSIQKYNAADRAVIASQRAFDFAQKRYDIGLTNTVEYLTTQNTLYSAESRKASAKYDLIFKLKVIDYYLGKELKL